MSNKYWLQIERKYIYKTLNARFQELCINRINVYFSVSFTGDLIRNINGSLRARRSNLGLLDCHPLVRGHAAPEGRLAMTGLVFFINNPAHSIG